MSVSIRLSVAGKKNHPFYRIVACTTRSKRDGQYLEILGTYDPGVNPPVLNLNHSKLEEWTKKGAIISDGVHKLLRSKPCTRTVRGKLAQYSDVTSEKFDSLPCRQAGLSPSSAQQAGRYSASRNKLLRQ